MKLVIVPGCCSQSQPSVDAIGTIVGRGEATSRKLSTVSATRLDAKTGIEVPVEENIDDVNGLKDPAEFIYNAIAPAEVDYVLFDRR